MKTKQTKPLKRLLDMGWQRSRSNYWVSLRICLRNNYKIMDATL
ncbi:hypothetical protein [Dysgonomonas mossii]